MPSNPITAHAAKVATSPIRIASASVRKRLVTSSQTPSGQGNTLATTIAASAIAGGQSLSRHRHATPAPSTRSGPRAPRSSEKRNGHDRSETARQRQSRTPSNRNPKIIAPIERSVNSAPASQKGSRLKGTTARLAGAGYTGIENAFCEVAPNAIPPDRITAA